MIDPYIYEKNCVFRKRDVDKGVCPFEGRIKEEFHRRTCYVSTYKKGKERGGFNDRSAIQ